jgi:hypothetical protein
MVQFAKERAKDEKRHIDNMEMVRAELESRYISEVDTLVEEIRKLEKQRELHWSQKFLDGKTAAENHCLTFRSDYWKEECRDMIKKFEKMDKEVGHVRMCYEQARQMLVVDPEVYKKAAKEAEEGHRRFFLAQKHRGPLPTMEKLVTKYAETVETPRSNRTRRALTPVMKPVMKPRDEMELGDVLEMVSKWPTRRRDRKPGMSARLFSEKEAANLPGIDFSKIDLTVFK